MQVLRTPAFLLLGIASCFTAYAQHRVTDAQPSQFDSFKGDGYYWYKENSDDEQSPKKAEIPPPPKPPAAAKSEPAAPRALSADWLSVNMPKLLNLAIDKPTTENVANYMYAQRVALDKSQVFAEKGKEVVATEQFLDENNRFPVAQFAQIEFLRDAKKAQDKALVYLAEKSGLWVFVDTPEKCSACEGYVQDVLIGYKGSKGVATKFNFDFRKIYVNSPQGRIAAKKLNLKGTPTTVLVVPPNGFYLVSQGLMAQSTLSDRLLLAAKVNGALPKDLEEQINPYNKGILSTDEIEAGGQGAESSAPSAVMKKMRARIKGSP